MGLFKRNKDKQETFSADVVQPDATIVMGEDDAVVDDSELDDTMPGYVGKHASGGKGLGSAAAAWEAISSAAGSAASTAAGAGKRSLGAHSVHPASDEAIDPDSTQAFLARTAQLLDAVENEGAGHEASAAAAAAFAFTEAADDEPEEDWLANAIESTEEPPFGTQVIDPELGEDDNTEFEKYVAPSHAAPKKKMKKSKVIGIIIAAIVALFLVAYGAGCYYFSKHFTYGTTISDIDCSFMTVPEVEKLMSDKADKYTMEVVGREDKKGEIKGADIAFKYDEKAGQVQKLLKEQGPFMYPVSFIQKKFMHQEGDSLPIEFTFDEDALKSAAEGLEMFDASKSRKPVDAYPEFDMEKDEYVAHPEDQGTLVDKEKAITTISDKAKQAISEVDLDAEECYVKPKVTTETPELTERIKQLDEYVPFALTYEFEDGHTEQLNGEDMFEWLVKDKDGKPTKEFDDEQVADWVREFAKKHDRIGTTRTFKSVDGNTYEVSGGTYGWSVDEAAEVEAIKNMLETKKSEKREPIWAGKSAVDAEIGEPDWGDTYIELNIATQHMYVIKDGEKVAEYDVVTGLPNGKRDTPTGVYYIMEKMQNKVLRGNRIGKDKYEYETPVAYWLRVTGDGVGFHDASWQPSFGGNRYTYAGSHGCINMSYSTVQELYSLVDTGTPVVIHYN